MTEAQQDAEELLAFIRQSLDNEPLGPERKNQESQSNFFNRVTSLNDIVSRCLKLKLKPELLRDNRLTLQILKKFSQFLNWRLDTVAFLSGGELWHPHEPAWAEKELRRLIAMSGMLTEPVECSRDIFSLVELQKLEVLGASLSKFEEEFKEKIFPVDLSEDFSPKVQASVSSSRHHTRSRLRIHRQNQDIVEDFTGKKILDRDLLHLRKKFETELAPLQKTSKYYSEIMKLVNDITPIKIQYTAMLQRLNEAKQSYAKWKSNFDPKNPKYDWSQQYLRMNSYFNRDIEGLLESIECQRIIIDSSELEDFHNVFAWFQKAKKEVKKYLTETGEIDISNVPANNYSFAKSKLEEALRQAPLSLELRLEKEQLVVSKPVSYKPIKRKQKVGDVAARNSKRVFTAAECINRSKQRTVQVKLPWTSGNLTLINLGTISARPGFHNADYIYPIGFLSRRKYNSNTDPPRKALFLNKILAGRNGIIFRVEREDDPSQCWEADTPTGAYTLLQQAINDRRAKLGQRVTNTGFSGPIMFGLDHRSQSEFIHRKIECLEGVEKCREYIFVDNRADSTEVESESEEEEAVPNNDKIMKQAVVYRDEELVLLHSLKCTLDKESSSKKILFQMLNIGISDQDRKLPDITRKSFSSKLKSLISDVDGVIPVAQLEICSLLVKLSDTYKRLRKNLKRYRKGIENTGEIVQPFKGICKHINVLIEKGFRDQRGWVLDENISILNAEPSKVVTLFPVFQEFFDSYKEIITCELQEEIEDYVVDWKKNTIFGRWFQVDLDGKMSLSLCTEYNEQGDMHECYIDSEVYEYVLAHFCLWPGGLALRTDREHSTLYKQPEADVLYFISSDYTITGKVNAVPNLYDSIEQAPDWRREESHGKLDPDNAVGKEIFVFFGGMLGARIDCYLEGNKTYRILYDKTASVAEGSTEDAHLFSDGRGKSCSTNFENSYFAFRFKKANETSFGLRLSRARNATREKDEKHLERLPSFSSSNGLLEKDNFEEDYLDFSDDGAYEEVDDEEADPDFKPSRMLLDEVDNLRDFNLPGKKLIAGNSVISAIASKSRKGSKTPRVDFHDMPLNLYAERMLHNLRKWSRTQSWYLKNKKENERRAHNKHVRKPGSKDEDRKNGRKILIKVLEPLKDLGDYTECVIKIEQAVHDQYLKPVDGITEDAMYFENANKYKDKIRILSRNLRRNVVIASKIVKGELSGEEVCRMEAIDFQDEATKKKREREQQLMDQDRFLVKPSDANISTADEKIDMTKMKDLPPTIKEDKKIPVDERSKEVSSLNQQARRASVESIDIMKEEHLSSTIKFTMEGDLAYQREQQENPDPFMLVKELEELNRWSGTIMFPSLNDATQIISADCSMKLFQKETDSINSDYLKLLQKHFMCQLPELLRDDNLVESTKPAHEQLVGEKNLPVNIMRTNLKTVTDYLNYHSSTNEHVLVVAALTCDLLLEQYEEYWGKHLSVGAFNMVKGYGFEMYVFPPFFDADDSLPDLIKHLPFAWQRKPLIVFDLKPEEEIQHGFLSVVKPFRYLLGDAPTKTSRSEESFNAFTESYNFLSVMKDSFDGTDSFSKIIFDKKKQDQLDAPSPIKRENSFQSTLNRMDSAESSVFNNCEEQEDLNKDNSSDTNSRKRSYHGDPFDMNYERENTRGPSNIRRKDDYSSTTRKKPRYARTEGNESSKNYFRDNIPTTCKYWKEGRCNKGDSCRFGHYTT